jgi:hypothetical protein
MIGQGAPAVDACKDAGLLEGCKGQPRLHPPVVESWGGRIGALVDPDGTLVRSFRISTSEEAIRAFLLPQISLWLVERNSRTWRYGNLLRINSGPLTCFALRLRSTSPRSSIFLLLVIP